MNFKMFIPVKICLSDEAVQLIKKKFEIGGNWQFEIQDAIESVEPRTSLDDEFQGLRKGYGEIIFQREPE